jgi:hypothetical protein
MTYFDLVSSHIKRNGGDGALITAVADYLERQSSSHQSGIANPVQEPILIIDCAPSTYGQYDFSAGPVGKNLQRCS